MTNSGEGEYHQEKSGCTRIGFIFFVLALGSGTMSALSCKVAYDTSSTGIDGQLKAFAKPIMMLLLMFLGMMPSVLLWLTLPKESRGTISYKSMALLAIPSFCDLLCTLLLLVAQLYLTASLWQMMRGSIIVMTALVKRFGLFHRLRTHMWIGISILTIALLLVACSSLYNSSGNSNAADSKTGIMLVMLGCLAQAVQYVFEERLMMVDNVPPLMVICCEGFWGTVLTLFVIYPVAYMLPGKDNGSFEDPFDAISMISNNRLLQIVTFLFVISVTAYNCLSVYLTKHLSAIWHAILDSFRPVTIWGVGLFIHYSINPNYGEAWVQGSSLQLLGLVVLLFGTAVYNGSIKVTNEDEYEEIEEGSRTIESELAMASVSLQRSPNIIRNLRKTDDERGAEYEMAEDTRKGYQRVQSREV